MKAHAFLLAAMLIFATTAHSQVPANEVPESIQKRVQSLRSDLESKGFEVAQGAWRLFTIDDCKYLIAKIGNCSGNNPTAPYIFATVPLWPNEFADQTAKGLLGPTWNDTWGTHRLDPREALVIVGLLPPPAGYFGLQTYVWSREGTTNERDVIYRSIKDPFMKKILFMKSSNPSRTMAFASIGESNNNVVIERKSGKAFDQERSFIITPDATMERQMTDALLRAGVPDRKDIFTEPVSKDIVRLGLDAKSDDMVTLIRYALPEDEAAGNKWRERLPLVVLRVREKTPSRAVEPYPAPVREEHIAKSELGLKDDANKLIAAVKQKWGQSQASTSPFESLFLMVDLYGPHCLMRPQNCLGDTSDTDYQISTTEGLDAGEVVAVVGTLGTKTGNATYTSLSVNEIPDLIGVLNLSQKDLAGSASAFSGSVADSDKFYVQYFARDCRGLEHCTQVTEKMVPKGDKIKIIQRNYVVPGTLRGPDPTQLVNPTLIVLKNTHRR